MSLSYPVPQGGTASNVVIIDTDGDTLTDTDIVNLFDDGDIGRAKLTEDAAAVYGIPVRDVMAADGAALGITEAAGDFYLVLGTNTIGLKGETANNETEASIGYVQFILPPEYVAGGDVTFRMTCSIAGAGTNNGSTIDISAYKFASGAVGSDICATAAQTFAAKATYYNKDFSITATSLSPGDCLIIKITASVIENASSDLIFYSDPPRFLLDIKG